MNDTNHVLISVWDKFPELFRPEDTSLDPVDIRQLISDIFIVGEYYHFLIDFLNRSITHHSSKICDIHGLGNLPHDLQQILDLTHPDDISFVLRAEEQCYAKVAEIGVEYTKQLKSSYCFRMRVADGSYRLFHHQAIVLDVDPQNRIVRSLNIHTDIQHLTAENNYTAAVIGINGRSDFHQIDLAPFPETPRKKSPLTKRELEILPLIAKGLSSRSIAQRLEISQLTVRVHRKNILRKMNSKNSSCLIRKCIEKGLL